MMREILSVSQREMSVLLRCGLLRAMALSGEKFLVCAFSSGFAKGAVSVFWGSCSVPTSCLAKSSGNQDCKMFACALCKSARLNVM